MGRLAVVLVAVLLGATACGSAASLRSAVPLRNALVYAKPDGTWESPGKMQIWVAARDGTHRKVLTVGDEPSVSPDGRYVAYVSDANAKTPKVLVMPTAGGTPTTVGTGDNPTWAPNSRYLAIYDVARYRFVAVVDVVKRKTMTTLPAFSGYSFSPDSRQIAYTPKSGLEVVPIRGGTPVRVTDGSYPVWGTPGIAFFRGVHTVSGDVWLTGPHPNDARQLTHTGVGAMPFAFSADGTKLLAYYPPNHDGRLWAVDVPSGRTRALTRWLDLFPTGLSSNGASVLAIAGCIDTEGTLETIPFAGGKPHVIVNGPCSASWNAR